MIELEFSGGIDQKRVVEGRSRIATELGSLGLDRRRLNRALSIFVELAQNVHRYSVRPGSGIVRVACNDDEVTFFASNEIDAESRDSFAERLRSLERLDARDIREAIRTQRRGTRTKRGAGLGLLEIARLSDEGLKWKIFDVDDRCVVELRAAIKVVDMESLAIDRGSDTMGVSCDAEKGIVELFGESYPEDAFAFFEPVTRWLTAFLETNPSALKIVCTITYLNSSSSKCLFDLFDAVSQAMPEKCKVSVVWRYEKDDDDNREVGEEYAEDLEFPFSLEEIE